MILIMVIKISFKMKIMKNISIIDFMEIITINDNSHISTKRKTKHNTYYIQTMRRVTCLICNISFIKTKWSIFFQFMIPV